MLIGRIPAWQWRVDVPADHVKIPCGDCGRRVAWWTAKIRPGWLGLRDLTYRGWKWLGEGTPVRFRGPFVDVECRVCGWANRVARQGEPWWIATPELIG